MRVDPRLAHGHRQRRLRGLRGTPGRLALAVFRLPLRLYRRGAGWMLGRTFLMLVHVGRKTGQPHDTVAMVLADDPHTGEVVICSAWGPDAEWLRNLHAGRARDLHIGRDRFVPEHRFLSEDEAVSVGIAFRRHHPRRLRILSAVLGWGDLRRDAALREFVRGHPFVALRPARAMRTEPREPFAHSMLDELR
jgi:deazaflavin-dependent oxidoreductase (nitroreductase family)